MTKILGDVLVLQQFVVFGKITFNEAYFKFNFLISYVQFDIIDPHTEVFGVFIIF